MNKKIFSVFILCVFALIIGVFLFKMNKQQIDTDVINTANKNTNVSPKEKTEVSDEQNTISIKDYFSATSTVDSTWPSYTNSKFGFTIDYPKNLNPKQYDESDTSNIVLSESDGMWIFNIKTVSTNIVTVDEWMKNENSKLSEKQQYRKVKKLSINGIDSAILVQAQEVENTPTGILYRDNTLAILISNKYVHIMTHRLFSDSRNDELEQMALSFRFGK